MVVDVKYMIDKREEIFEGNENEYFNHDLHYNEYDEETDEEDFYKERFLNLCLVLYKKKLFTYHDFYTDVKDVCDWDIRELFIVNSL